MTDLMLKRREWIGVTAGALSLAAGRGIRQADVAAVVTEFTHRSHAHVILENCLEPYYFNGQLTESGIDVVSLYVDQFPADHDIGRDVAKQYGIKFYSTIAEALRLREKGYWREKATGSFNCPSLCLPHQRWLTCILAGSRLTGALVGSNENGAHIHRCVNGAWVL
jgi:hypothetical protein